MKTAQYHTIPRIIISSLAILAYMFLQVACTEEVLYIETTGIRLNKSEILIHVGDNEVLTVSIMPSNATNKNVTWVSSNTNIATVSDGIVVGVGPGTTEIVAKSGDFFAKCVVTVTIPPSSLSLNASSIDLYEFSTYTLTATVLPEDASNKDLYWESSNSSIATVSDGIVEGITAGECTITVSTVDGSQKATCSVLVHPASITLNYTSISLIANSKETLYASIIPENAPYQNICWESSNPSIASVSDGVVLGVSEGECIVTASTEDKKLSASCSVVVSIPNNVCLFYFAGFNSLYSYLRLDLNDIVGGYLPEDGEDVVLIYSRISPNSNFKDGSSSALYRIYRSREKASNGTYPVIKDTLLKFDAQQRACSAETITEVLNCARNHFPAKRYGMVFSSHGRGWVPNGYYVDPTPPVSYAPSLKQSSSGPALPYGAHVYVEPDYEEGDIVTKSIGEDIGYVGSTKVSYEMEIEDFASAIPFKLDYLLVDACLMGGVEFAYALRGKVGIVGFSQAEILADGFDYKKIVSQLCTGAEPLPLEVCRDYYSLYNSRSGSSHSATISAVDCDKLSSLASVCKTLFEKYRSEIAALDVDSVQGFSGGEKKWFFDLEDVLLKAGISDSEKAQLSAALEGCVPYKGCTGQYYTVTERRAVEVKHFCGLSMFMPSAGNDYLNNYYKNLKWNNDTWLIK